MKRISLVFMALIIGVTLIGCSDDTAITDLTDVVNNLQTQLNAFDVSVEDLEGLNDALQTELDDLTAELEAAKTANDDLGVDLVALQENLDATSLLLNDAIDLLTAEVAEGNAELLAQIADLLAQLAVFELPIIYGVDTYVISVDEVLDYKLSAFDIQEGDLTSEIVMTSPGAFTETGVYQVTFEVIDGDGNVGEFVVDVTVIIPSLVIANYLNSIDLSKLDTENKGKIIAALERYLLENVYGGVPLYTGASFEMYSDRVQLFSNDLNGVMGFGDAFSQFTADDSTVLMFGDIYGEVGEYTWRESFTYDPDSLNPWTADDSNSSDFIELFTGSLYSFYFDASKIGYEINSDLAAGEPIPVNPEEINGEIYATIWEVPVRDDLVWSFHEDTDVSGFAVGYEVLDAEDYLWTWQYALDNDWFRAVSGGGDFITSGIKNAADYADGNASWEDVGMKNVEGKIQLEFTTDKTMFDIKYMLTNSWTPINQQLFEDVGAANYGLSPETVASSGIYVFETWTSGQFLYFGKNESHPNADIYHYTGQQFRYIADDDARFEEFLAGRLESTSIPTARINEYILDPRVIASPDDTVWRLMINGFGTEQARDAYIAQYPEFGLAEDFTPEPILQYLEMRQALYYGFDRYEAAVNAVKTYLPAFTYFPSTFFIDAKGGISVRGTEDGAAIVDDFGGGTYGFSPDDAVAYFKSAVAKGIDDGYYTAGTAEAYTTIELSFTYASSGNAGVQNMVAQIEQQYEALLVDDVNFVNIDIIVADVAFPDNYNNFMLVANTDLGLGGISGSLLDAPSFLNIFNDNNISGFTMNWGIDTHSVTIPVVYRGLDGITVHELWSYNALVSVLNGKTYIRDGVEQTVFDSLDGLINAYIDMEGSTVVSSTDGADLAQYVLGMTVSEFAVIGGYDAAYANIVVTGDGGNILFIVSEIAGGFELVEHHLLFTEVADAIKSHSGYPGYFLGATGPMTDQDVIDNSYLIELDNGFTTVADYATYTGAPVTFIELWAVDWDDWSDVYVVIHIGEYYIGWYWL